MDKDGEKIGAKRAVSPLNGQPVPTGRPKGVPNKATTRFKTALNQLFEQNAEKMGLWLEEIDNPKDRFDVLSKFCNYLYPQLARSEVKQENRYVDKDGEDLHKADLEILERMGIK